MTEISSFLAEIRKEKGFSQQKMADWFQIPQRTWANYETGRSDPNLGFLIKLHERGYDIPGLTDGSAKEVLDKISNETGLTHDEIYRQRIEQLKDLPLDTPIDELPNPEYKKESPEESPAAPQSANGDRQKELAVKRKANTTAAITMLENAAKSIQAAVMLLKEGIGE